MYRDLAGVLGDADIDAVDLCLPTFLHEEVAVAALQAGKHVLVEKPMALDGVSARRMIAAAEQAGRIFMCAQVLRFFPEYVALKNAMPGLGGGAGRLFPAALRGSGLGRMAERPVQRAAAACSTS